MRLGLPIAVAGLCSVIWACGSGVPAGPYGWEALSHPEVRAALPEDARAWLDANVQVTPPVTMVDKFLVIEGCRAHQCDQVQAFVAINRASNDYLIARTERGAAGVTVTMSQGWSDVLAVSQKLGAWRTSLK